MKGRNAFHLLREVESGLYLSHTSSNGVPRFASSFSGATFVFRDRAIELAEAFAQQGCIVTIVPPLPGKTAPVEPPRWWQRGRTKEAA